MPKARTVAFLVVAATSLVDHTDSALAQAQPCGLREYAHNAYTVCEVDLGKHTVRLYWKRSDGTPYAYLSSLPRALEHEAGRLLFATNAGMFDPALKPVGLYVEQGRELVHVNTKTGYGNFHMKPNGIFYVAAGRAGVAETQAFLKQRPQADLATQSGPMLVINGACILVSTAAAPRSKRAMVWEYARMAKSYSSSLREKCRSTRLHVYSETG
jgi:uncharacterized protein YigE (DUF2233 family)